jgi:hypothetical protein
LFFSYTREFNLDKNTHLIAVAAQGAKHDLAASCPGIHIVAPSWLEACSKSGKRVGETAHALSDTTKKRTKPLSVLSRLDEFLAAPAMALRSIFEFHKIYLLGFEEDTELKQKLGKLIRRGKGTIFWEMNEDISIMILHNTCDDSLRYVETDEVCRHGGFELI